MLNNLKELCRLNGASGDEGAVRAFIIDKIKDNADYSVDSMGNIIAFKKGREVPKNKIMLDAHMDEVGFIITSVQSDGTLTFSEVGGIDPTVIIGRQVTVGSKGLIGVVGAKAVHNLSAEERDKTPEMDSLYIDIGAADRKEAEKYAAPGDYAYFVSEYAELGDDIIKSKAIDDRFGCALLIDMINSELPYDLYFTFTVQEEIGLRGAKTAAYTVNPDIAIAVETTTAADIDGISENKQVCRLGKGAVVSFMDRSTMYDRDLYNAAVEQAEKKGIPWQTKSLIAGGNNCGAIHTSRGGVKTIAVSAPCRYLHSPSCIANKKDLKACADIIYAIVEKAAEMDI